MPSYLSIRYEELAFQPKRAEGKRRAGNTLTSWREGGNAKETRKEKTKNMSSAWGVKTR